MKNTIPKFRKLNSPQAQEMRRKIHHGTSQSNCLKQVIKKKVLIGARDQKTLYTGVHRSKIRITVDFVFHSMQVRRHWSSVFKAKVERNEGRKEGRKDERL